MRKGIKWTIRYILDTDLLPTINCEKAL